VAHSECDQQVQSFEYDGRLDHSVVVQFSQILHNRDSSLIILGQVDLFIKQ